MFLANLAYQVMRSLWAASSEIVRVSPQRKNQWNSVCTWAQEYQKAFLRALAFATISLASMQRFHGNLCLLMMFPLGIFCSVDVRLVDVAGALSSVGLVQIKTDAGFGSVCGANPAAADVICRSLGFAFGTVSSSPCGFYGASNLCGAPGSPVARIMIPCYLHD